MPASGWVAVAARRRIVRILVTGRDGQVARSLVERAAGASGIELVTAGRPELDLAAARTVGAAIAGGEAGHRGLGRRLYGGRPGRGRTRSAPSRSTQTAPARWRRGRRRSAAPPSSISPPTMSFRATSEGEYAETDATDPHGVYGRTKLDGREGGRSGQSAPRHPAHGLGLQPVRQEFRQDHARRWRAQRDHGQGRRRPVGQPDIGARTSPTAFCASPNVSGDGARPDRYGIFHLAGAGATNWAGLAEACVRRQAARWAGRRQASRRSPRRIIRQEPGGPEFAPVLRKALAVYGWRAPDWRDSCRTTVARLVKEA